jgi:DNA-directed RNA polymerase-3 subunit RPC5
MVEVDIPVDYTVQYDRQKGMTWGTALHKSLAAKGGNGSLGLAGGFGLGGVPAGAGRARRGVGEEDDQVEGGDWNEAVRLDRVLRTQTLGGLSVETKEARYMVGVFQGSK